MTEAPDVSEVAAPDPPAPLPGPVELAPLPGLVEPAPLPGPVELAPRELTPLDFGFLESDYSSWPERLGGSVANVGDLDGDGIEELAVASRWLAPEALRPGLWILFFDEHRRVARASRDRAARTRLRGGAHVAWRR